MSTNKNTKKAATKKVAAADQKPTEVGTTASRTKAAAEVKEEKNVVNPEAAGPETPTDKIAQKQAAAAATASDKTLAPVVDDKTPTVTPAPAKTVKVYDDPAALVAELSNRLPSLKPTRKETALDQMNRLVKQGRVIRLSSGKPFLSVEPVTQGYTAVSNRPYFEFTTHLSKKEKPQRQSYWLDVMPTYIAILTAEEKKAWDAMEADKQIPTLEKVRAAVTVPATEEVPA